MEKLSAARQHALPFLRHWNRPMTGGTAFWLALPVLLMALNWLNGDSRAWLFFNAGLVVFVFADYTRHSVRTYRRDRHEIHDGKDTFRW